jgi:ABC-type polysaccharide/polyol phosphate export permease
LPSTYVFESMRSVLVSGTLDWRFLAISFAMNCLYLLLALLWFRMNFKKSLALGLGRFD